MSENIEEMNSDEKFEIEFDKAIGLNFKKKNDIYYLLAKEQIDKFTNHFRVTGDIIVIEADKDTFIAILAGLYEEFHTASDKFNFLDPKNVMPNVK